MYDSVVVRLDRRLPLAPSVRYTILVLKRTWKSQKPVRGLTAAARYGGCGKALCVNVP